MTSASSASNTADIILEPLLSGTPEVRQAAKILCDGFTVPMGRVFPKGKVTDELIAWRVQLIEGVLEMQKRGCPGPVIVAKRRGSDEVLGVAAWVTLREGEEKNAETGEPQWYLPMPAIPAESGDVDPEIWKQWRGAFTDIQKRYGSDMGGTYTELKYLAVSETAQRSGVGSMLLKRFLDDVAPYKGRILLITAPTPHAVPFYRKHSFAVVEKVTALPDLPQGECFFMRRDADEGA